LIFIIVNIVHDIFISVTIFCQKPTQIFALIFIPYVVKTKACKRRKDLIAEKTWH